LIGANFVQKRELLPILHRYSNTLLVPIAAAGQYRSCVRVSGGRDTPPNGEA